MTTKHDMTAPKMTRVTVRVPKTTLDQINNWVDTLGVRRSHFLGIALVAGVRSLIRASALEMPLADEIDLRPEAGLRLETGSRPVTGSRPGESSSNAAENGPGTKQAAIVHTNEALQSEITSLRSQVTALREQLQTRRVPTKKHS